MVNRLNYISFFSFLILSCNAFKPLKAQDLDPRAYIWMPVKGNFLSSGFALSAGGVLSDPSLPIENLKANVQTVSLTVNSYLEIYSPVNQISFGNTKILYI
jgi:hypothetical protein